MLGSNMQIQRVLVKTLVVTVFTCKGHVIVVNLLVMIVHGVLILLCFTAMLANEETILILLILVDHTAVGLRVLGHRGFNFLRRGARCWV